MSRCIFGKPICLTAGFLHNKTTVNGKLGNKENVKRGSYYSNKIKGQQNSIWACYKGVVLIDEFEGE